MDGEAWWATVHGVEKSQIQLSDFTDAAEWAGLHCGQDGDAGEESMRDGPGFMGFIVGKKNRFEFDEKIMNSVWTCQLWYLWNILTRFKISRKKHYRFACVVGL